MARKLPGLRRELDARSLFSVAYGQIASSIYFALGVVALHAVGFTPLVLLVAGVIFLLVAFSYAEGVTALPETGGAATFVRRAFNDIAGFMTGWVLFLDYLIVMALAALFVPHYLGAAIQVPALTRNPWDVIVGVAVIGLVAAIRLVRRPSSVRHRRPRAGPRPTDTARPRRARLRPRLLASRARRRHVARPRPDVELAAVRAPAGDARLRRSRERREPRRGGPQAEHRPAPVTRHRDRDRGGHVRRDRHGGALGLPGPADEARHGLAASAARRGGHRDRCAR